MNYIKQINAFYDWLETNQLSQSEIVLWHALMHINNKSGWKADFAVAISVLETKTGLTRRTIERARNKLSQSGLIEWKSRRGNKAAIYKLRCLYGNFDVQDDVQHDVQPVAQDDVQPVAINKLNKTKREEEEANPIRAYEKNFSPMTPTQMEKLWQWVDDFGNAEVVCMAVSETALVNPRVPFMYLDRMLVDWHKRKLFTVADVERAKQEHAAKVLHLNKKKANGVDWDELERMIGDD